MIYFFNSSRKSDKLTHPITVCANNERRAFVLAILSFKKHNMDGTPKRINI